MTDKETLELVQRVAKATRLKNIDVEERQETRHVITLDGVILAYVDPNRNGFRVHVQHHGYEHRETVETITEAAQLVKTSERRQS